MASVMFIVGTFRVSKNCLVTVSISSISVCTCVNIISPVSDYKQDCTVGVKVNELLTLLSIR